MARNIVLCSDGTGNSGGKARGTNVWRFYKALDRDPKNAQIAFYQDGVGTQDFKLFRILGGAFGYGLNANIREMYTFLVHNFRPGDAIYLLGFSRGAFTVRAFAYLLTVCGIAKPAGDPKETEQRISNALKRYHNWRSDIRKITQGEQEKATARMREGVDLEDMVRNYRYLGGQPLGDLLKGAKTKDIDKRDADEVDVYRPTIKFLGVWDTVDAVGLPIDELTEALDWLFKFRFYNFDRCPIAEYNYHAISLDDERHTFHPVMWDEECNASNQTVEQVWFSGVHSNVGGGYPKDEMAYLALDWLMQKAEAVDGGQGLKFLPHLRQDASKQANANGKIYDSRAGLATYYRYKPRNVEEICAKAHTPTLIHESVFERIERTTEGYAPVAIPSGYSKAPHGGTNAADKHPDKRLDAQNLAAQVIWWRRILYFLLLVSSVGFFLVARRLAATPLPISEGGQGLIDRLLATLAELLPEFLGKWFLAFSGRSGTLILFVALFVAWFVFRGYLKRRSSYLGKMGWNLASGTASDVPEPLWLESIAGWVKRLYLPRPVRDLVRIKLFPLGVLVLVAGLLVFWALNLFVIPRNHMACESIRDSFTGLGAASDPVQLKDFHTCNPWYVTGIKVEKGVSYSIEVEESGQWTDAGIVAGADGLKEGPTFLQKLFSFTKRGEDEGWFKLLGDINGKQIVIGSGTRFKARNSGPLHLFVNDAVCDVCLKGVFAYYRGNQGGAVITVKPIP